MQIQVEMEAIIEMEVDMGVSVEWRKCDRKVNCVAHWLLSTCVGQNIVFRKVGALPRGFLHVLNLEGYPHFSSMPGADYVALDVDQNRIWDPGRF